ncbi:dimethylamine monooxygenase subunit DmmA family protein [Actinocorallia aurea]
MDATGKDYAVLALGEAARPVAAAWAQRIEEAGATAWVSYAAELGDGVLAAFRERLAAASVGWRLMLCGPEHEVLFLRGEAVRAGALPVEIRMHATAVGRRRVYCAHCRHVTSGDIGAGDLLLCGGCGLTLVCHHHFSRRLAAYLAYQADAEVVA